MNSQLSRLLWPGLPALALLAGCGDRSEAPLSGYVEAEYVRIAAPVAGRLTALKVARGDQVQAAQALFVLDQEQETAAVREAEARVQKATATASDLAKGKRQDELAVLAAQLDAARVAARQSESDLQRQQQLAASGFVSTATLTAFVTRRDADRSRVAELDAQLRVGRLAARDDTRAAAQADAAAAQASAAQARWRLDQKAVAAPVTARVEDTLYRIGEWVPAGYPVVNLLEPGAVKIRFFVPEARLPQMQLGATVQVACDGCGNPFAATIRYVSRSAEFTPPVIYNKDNRSRLVYLVEAWPAPADAARLKPGQPVDVRLGAGV